MPEAPDLEVIKDVLNRRVRGRRSQTPASSSPWSFESLPLKTS